MKEYIKLFNDLQSADGYIIEDIPFTSTVKRDAVSLEPQNARCNMENKKLKVVDDIVYVVDASRIPQENTILILRNGSEVELTGNKITSAMIIDYRSDLVEAVIGTNVTKIGAVDLMDVISGLGTPFLLCHSLTSVTIPSSVTSIGGFGCTGLTNIVIPDSVTIIGDSAFQSCAELTSVTLGSGITTIDNRMFSDCKSLTGITIPDSITSIGNEIFSGCTSLSSITIPSGVTSIGYSAFNGCGSLTSITVDSGNTHYDSRDNCNAIIETSSNTLIQGCSTTVIPSSVTSIGDNAFSNCTGLSSITIPDSVTNIGYEAFCKCRRLNVVVPSSVTTIDEDAFLYVANVEYNGSATGSPWGAKCVNGYIEDSLVYTDSNKTDLKACISSTISAVTIPNSVTSIGYGAFDECASLISVTIPSSVTNIGNSYGAFSKCVNLSSITIDSSNTHYDSRSNCNAIIETSSNTLIQGCNTTVIPSGVTSISDNALDGCVGLTSIVIPDSVTSLGQEAFSGCTGLSSVTIGSGVTIVNSHAFDGCTSLTSITIPSSVTSISFYAFWDCSGLISVTIPSSVTEICAAAFNFCFRLNNIIYEGTKTQWTQIDKGPEWNGLVPATVVHCTDGDVAI